ncbi:hypothetical protein [Streptomyces vilmorinianum]|uniref:hypothetical protein n=1 Tax=Streptomyces vilmorinianum TaxID=3051092 RepID=UPI0010FADD65|nr:hypothetical protein [Streptomyces vilmorinianum]
MSTWLAVRMTNEVTEKLGRGGEPLPMPEDGAVPDTGRYVPRAEAKGTACAALATTRVPAEGRDGKVRIAIADGGVVVRCTLRAPGEADDDAEGSDSANLGPRLVELTSWRGDWGTVVRERDSGPDGAWAFARCDGENTGFAAHWGDDYPYREKGEKYEPATAAEPHGRMSGACR